MIDPLPAILQFLFTLSPGTHNKSIIMDRADYERLVKPRWNSLV